VRQRGGQPTHCHCEKKKYNDYIVAKADYDRAIENGAQTLEEPAIVKKPADVQIRIAAGTKFWELETPEFQEMVTQDAEMMHNKLMAEWEEAKQVPKTPQQFHQQLAFAGQFLQPVADAIALQMQAAVSIYIIGPIADRNGEVEVRR